MITNYTNLNSPKKNNSIKYQTIKKWVNISSLLYITLIYSSCKMQENSNYGTGISKLIHEITNSEKDEETTQETTRPAEESAHNFENNRSEQENSTTKSSTIKNQDLLMVEKTILLEKIHSNRDRGLSPYIDKYLEKDLGSFYITPEQLKDRLGEKTISALSNSDKQKVNITCLSDIINFSNNLFLKRAKKSGEPFYKSVIENTNVVRNAQSRFYCSGCDKELKYERLSFADKNLSWRCEKCKAKKTNYNNTDYLEIPMVCILNLPALGKEICIDAELEDINYLAFCTQNLLTLFEQSLEDLKSYKKEENDANFNPEKLYHKFTKYQYAQILELHLKKICTFNILRYVQNGYNPEKRNVNYLIPTESLLFLFDLPSENVYDLLNLIGSEENDIENKRQLRKNLLLFSLINELPEDFKYKVIEAIHNHDDTWIWNIEQIINNVYSKSCNSNSVLNELKEKIKNICSFSTFAFTENYTTLRKVYNVTKLMLLYRNFEGNIEDIKKFITRYENLMRENPRPSDLEDLLRAYSDCSSEEVKDFVAKSSKNYTINQITIMLALPDVSILNWAIENDIFKNYKPEEIKIFSSFAPVFKQSGLFNNLENLSGSKIADKIETNIRTSIQAFTQKKETLNNRLSISSSKNTFSISTGQPNTIKKGSLKRETNEVSPEILGEFMLKKREKSFKYPELEVDQYHNDHSLRVSEVIGNLNNKSEDEGDYNEIKKLKSEIKSFNHKSRNSFNGIKSKKITNPYNKGITNTEYETEPEKDFMSPNMYLEENEQINKRTSFKANDRRISDYKEKNNFNYEEPEYLQEQGKSPNFEFELKTNRKINDSFISRNSNKGLVRFKKVEDSLNLSQPGGGKILNGSMYSSSGINNFIPIQTESGKSRTSFKSNKSKN